MKSYIGTKVIKATPMTDLEFESEKAEFGNAKEKVNAYKNGQFLLRHGESLCCSTREPREPKDGFKVMYPDGYISWSPKYVFEVAYREISEAEKNLVIS